MEVVNGWCCCWLFQCRGIGVECVRARSLELCVACWASHLGLTLDATAGEVVAELAKREEVPA